MSKKPFQSTICQETSFKCAVKIIGDSWILLIIKELLKGSQRFNVLLEKVSGISPRTLSSRLKLLEQKKLINRISFDQVPPKVEYNLTPNGQEISKLIDSIQDFADIYFVFCGQNNTGTD
jgi:DNA-binding HxlR family transcriptional regulator